MASITRIFNTKKAKIDNLESPDRVVGDKKFLHTVASTTAIRSKSAVIERIPVVGKTIGYVKEADRWIGAYQTNHRLLAARLTGIGTYNLFGRPTEVLVEGPVANGESGCITVHDKPLISRDKRSIQFYRRLEESNPDLAIPLSQLWENRENFWSTNLQNKNTVIIYNLSDQIGITLQNRPYQIGVKPTSNWVTIKSMGRNNPFYMYTGGEDSIQISLSWYVVSTDPESTSEYSMRRLPGLVRTLESWARNDGYAKAPPILQLKWGQCDLFRGLYILTRCETDYSNFNDLGFKSRKNSLEELYSDDNITNNGLMPMVITQSLELKKITTNNSSRLSFQESYGSSLEVLSPTT